MGNCFWVQTPSNHNNAQGRKGLPSKDWDEIRDSGSFQVMVVDFLVSGSPKDQVLSNRIT